MNLRVRACAPVLLWRAQHTIFLPKDKTKECTSDSRTGIAHKRNCLIYCFVCDACRYLCFKKHKKQHV